MIKLVFRYVRRRICNLRWVIQAIVESLFTEPKKTETPNVNASFLVLIPHADDEWIGCSQIISKMKSVTLVDMDMEGGDEQEIHNLRKKELRLISDKYNRALYTLRKEKHDEFLRIIKESSPSYVLLPFFYDWHPEHIKVMDMLEQVLKKDCIDTNILMYQVSVPIGYKWINCVMPMSRHDLKRKWDTFREIYVTQQHIPYFRFKMQERINGRLTQSYASEVFSKMSRNEWLAAKPKIITKALKEKEQILRKLNNIRGIRNFVNN